MVSAIFLSLSATAVAAFSLALSLNNSGGGGGGSYPSLSLVQRAGGSNIPLSPLSTPTRDGAIPPLPTLLSL